MPQSLDQIKVEVEQLSLDDQMSLMETLLHSIRRRTLPLLASDDDLASMAADPDIQRELMGISAKFSLA
jgi:hypothetical protein